MARSHYSYEKRQQELKKKKKREEKLLKKQNKSAQDDAQAYNEYLPQNMMRALDEPEEGEEGGQVLEDQESDQDLA